MVRIVNGEIVKDDDPVLPTVNPASQNQQPSDSPQQGQMVQYQTPTIEVFGRKISPIWLSVGFFIYSLIFGFKGVIVLLLGVGAYVLFKKSRGETVNFFQMPTMPTSSSNQTNNQSPNNRASGGTPLRGVRTINDYSQNPQ